MGLDDLPEDFNPMGFMNGDRAVYDWDLNRGKKIQQERCLRIGIALI